MLRKPTDVVSNQYYVRQHHAAATSGGSTWLRQYRRHALDLHHHTQIATGWAGAPYLFCGRSGLCGGDFQRRRTVVVRHPAQRRVTYGSGLRTGDANIGTLPPYAQFNIGIARQFLLPNDPNPVTIRFDIVNLFDTVYEIRDGSGIGVFAPQFGPRRGFFLGLSKKI